MTKNRAFLIVLSIALLAAPSRRLVASPNFPYEKPAAKFIVALFLAPFAHEAYKAYKELSAEECEENRKSAKECLKKEIEGYQSGKQGLAETVAYCAQDCAHYALYTIARSVLLLYTLAVPALISSGLWDLRTQK